MLDQVLEGMRKTTEASIQMQQEAWKNWTSLWQKAAEETPQNTATATLPNPWESARTWQKKWEEALVDVAKRRQELLETQCKTGIRQLEDAFRLGQSLTPQEFQAKVIELYRASFESLKQISEAQMRELKTWAEHWSHLTAKGNG